VDHYYLYTKFKGQCLLQIWESKKTSKIRRDLEQLLTLTANISRTGHDIDKETQMSSRAIPAALEKKIV